MPVYKKIKEVLQDDNKKLMEDVKGEMDMYYFALFVFSCMEPTFKTNCLAELTLILDKDNFFNLVNVFGGRTIKIPTKDELNKYLKVVGAYYYIHYEGVNMSTALAKVGASGDEDIEFAVRKMRNYVNTTKIPKRVKDE